MYPTISYADKFTSRKNLNEVYQYWVVVNILSYRILSEVVNDYLLFLLLDNCRDCFLRLFYDSNKVF